MPIFAYLEKLFNDIKTDKVDISETDEQPEYIQCTECNRVLMKFTII